MADTPATPPASPVLDLRNRMLAGFLALLVPGLGHLYQRRRFKAAVYAVCILGLFFSGQALGNWKVVYLSDNSEGGRMAAGGGLARRLLQGYAAQWPVGLAAWPAMVQSARYHSGANDDRNGIDTPLDGPFDGALSYDSPNGLLPVARITGTIHLESVAGGLGGTVTGQTDTGQQITVNFDRVRELGRPISANDGRTLDAVVKQPAAGIELPPGVDEVILRGGITRPWLDRYQVPLGEQAEDGLVAELGSQRYEMAFVFTWIAGLLNVLAIWDALDGPAYGMGNEPELNAPRRKRKPRGAAKPAAAPPAPQKV